MSGFDQNIIATNSVSLAPQEDFKEDTRVYDREYLRGATPYVWLLHPALIKCSAQKQGLFVDFIR